MKLYGYWRSSSSWRVRIGLALKGISHETVPVHLVKGEQRGEDHRARNPMGQVPVLVLDDGRAISQSLAILEYLDEVHPQPPLLPSDPYDRALARALAEDVNSGTQPLQNLGLVRWGAQQFGADKVAWMRHWMDVGLTAMEARAARIDRDGPWLVGGQPSLAEVCLVPQLYNARRWGCDLSAWPTLTQAEAAAMALPAFQNTHPDTQPDAQPAPAASKQER